MPKPFSDLVYDPETGRLLRTISSGNALKGAVAGHVDKSGYVIIRYRGQKFLAHRIVWMIHNGFIPEGMQVDHKDINSLNNRIENLRLATFSQNMHNRRLSQNSTTNIKGLHKLKGCNGFQAKIKLNGKAYRKHFSSKEEGVAWLDMMRESLHGEFARKG